MIKSEGSFRETLQKGWLTTGILTETLSKFTGDLNAEQLKSMGYTDDQIKGILKMGVTAYDAATKVKTATQLIDTMKEAVGSGWAKTWQIVFGDFEEAKLMFTDVSNTLGGIIGASADARNQLLTGWKDLGGRTALIDAVKNSFQGVMGVVGALSGAFRDIFPATTSAQLMSFTEGLKNLTENFKLSDTTLNNLRSTFKGAFAILDIGKTIFLAVANAIGVLFGGVGNLGTNMIGATAAFGEWLTYWDNIIKKSDIFNTVLTGVAKGIREGFGGLAPIFDGISKAIGFVGEKFTELGKVLLDIKIVDIFSTIWKTIKTITEGLGGLLGKALDTIKNAFTNANFTGMFGAVAGLSIGAIALTISKFLKSITSPLEGFKGLLDGVTGILDGVRGSFEAYQTNLKAGTLLKIAIAIGILAASILTISLIDSGKLLTSLAAIGTLFTMLLGAMFLFTKIGDLKGATLKANVVMLSMSISILILSSAMKNLASLDWNGIAKGTVGIAALAGVLVASAKILSSDGGAMIKGSAGMVIFALAIKVLASVCADLSKLSWEEMSKGLIGVGVLMTEISLFLNTAKFSAKSMLTATGIVLLAAAMKILASACSDFGNLSWESISKGLVSIGVLLGELAIFSNVTANAKNMLSTGVALIAIAAAMKILASAMADFGNMSWESIAKGLVAMGGALTEITIAMKLIPKDIVGTAAGLVIIGVALKLIASALETMGNMSWESIVKGLLAMGVALAEIAIAVKLMPKDIAGTAAGLVVMGVALNLIASALTKMGDMSWQQIAQGLVAMGGSLAILAISLNAMNGTIAGSASLLVAAGALMLLAPALVMLGGMSWENVLTGLAALAGVIIIFGVSAAVLTPILPAMLGLGVALGLLGLSVLGIGVGLALAAAGISTVVTALGSLADVSASSATSIVTALQIIITGVAGLIPLIMAKIGEGIIAFCKVFTDNIPVVLTTINAVIKAIIDCLVTNIPAIVTGVLQILSGILAALVKWMPTIGQQVADIILALLKVLNDNITKFTVAAVDIILGFIKGITDKLPDIIQSAFNLIITFINGLADGIRNNTDAIGDACLNLTMAIVDGVGKLNDKFIEAGKYAVKGFVSGLASMPGELWDAASSLGTSALEAAKKALKEHSPSKAFHQIGAYGGEGLVNGLTSWASKVYDTSYAIGDKAVSTMSNAISGISDIVNADIDSQPVIRPVMDLTDIQNGSNQLYGMMDGMSTYGIDGSVNSVNSIAKTISNRQLLGNTIDGDLAKSGTVNNQTSPKQPVTLQLMLQNGKAIAEYIIDDVDTLMGGKNKITGRMVGV